MIALFMAVMGLGIAGVWTRDIVAADQLDIAAGRLRAREPGAGSFLLPHWIAEFGTAGLLLAGSIGLLAEAGRARVPVSRGPGSACVHVDELSGMGARRAGQIALRRADGDGRCRRRSSHHRSVRPLGRYLRHAPPPSAVGCRS